MTKQIEILVSRSFDYEDKYELEVKTTGDLTKEQYKTIIDSMEAIAKIIDPRINTLIALRKAQGKKKKE